ncbi:Calcium/calmodulin-dependent protein kinase type IV [Quaeritorhiza haematococci]|nr:Calcium/calmodulin-dependent protein kinase type IV [Quaeritorhiza haematococci]
MRLLQLVVESKRNCVAGKTDPEGPDRVKLAFTAVQGAAILQTALSCIPEILDEVPEVFVPALYIQGTYLELYAAFQKHPTPTTSTTNTAPTKVAHLTPQDFGFWGINKFDLRKPGDCFRCLHTIYNIFGHSSLPSTTKGYIIRQHLHEVWTDGRDLNSLSQARGGRRSNSSVASRSSSPHITKKRKQEGEGHHQEKTEEGQDAIGTPKQQANIAIELLMPPIIAPENPTALLIMPTCSTLEAYIQAHPREVEDLIQQLTGGVQYLHDKGIVHGNLKPDNIVLQVPVCDRATGGGSGAGSVVGGGKVRLIDFGHVVLEDIDTPLNRTDIGTKGYVPPDVARCTAREVDEYALKRTVEHMVVLAGSGGSMAKSPPLWVSK